MKRIMLISLILTILFVSGLFAAEQVITDSKVIKVIVYPEWAYVTRRASVKLSNTNGRLILNGLPAWIDHDSILVKTIPAGSVQILGVAARSIYLQKITEEEVASAQKKVITMQDRINDYYTELNVLEEQLKYLRSILPWKAEAIPHEGSVRAVSTSELADVEKYLSESMLIVMKQRDRINRTIRDVQPELDVLQKEWNELAGRAQYEQTEIAIDLQAQGNKTIDLEVSYLISGASWYPKYDARTIAGSSDIEIIYTAIVQQTTGEDWSSAAFTLSTIKPYLIRQKPELNPWYVTETYSSEETNVSLNRGANDDYYNKLNDLKAKQNTLYNFQEENQEAYGYYEKNIEQAKEVSRQAEERGTTVEFVIAGKYSVRTDGKPVKMNVGQATLGASRKYSSIPVVSRSTYVTGSVRNEAGFPFLPGVVEVYRDGNFIGKSKIDFVATRERFDLYLGLDERIKVSRTLDTKKSSRVLFGKKKVLRIGYNIEVQNYLDESVSIQIKDQLPISQSGQVKVKLTEIDPKIEPDEKGILTWDVDLGPQEKRTLYFEFEIEFPGDVYLDNANELEKQLEMMY